MPLNPAEARDCIRSAMVACDKGMVHEALNRVVHDLGPNTMVMLTMEVYESLPDDVGAWWRAPLTADDGVAPWQT